MMRSFTFVVLIGVLFAVLQIGDCAAASYSVQYLGVTAGYDGSWAVDINDKGDVAGTSASIYGFDSFLWSRDRGITDLSLQGIYASAGINDGGQMAGLIRNEDSLWYRPYIRNADGSATNLSVPDDVANAWVAGIDDGGRVFVDLEYRDVNRILIEMKPAVIDANGSLVFIETPDDNTSISAVSNSGTVIVNNRYLWSESGGLHALPWLASAANVEVRGVNDYGWVIGMLGDHAMRWDASGNSTDLGIGFVGGINNLGQAVGAVDHHAVIWDTDGSVINLPSLEGYSSAYAYAINDNGQVVGEAREDWLPMAVLWQPVPEPSAFVVLACALVGILSRTRRVEARRQH